MRFAKAGVMGAGAAGLAMLLSGCVVFFGTSKVKQVGDKPKVKISFGVCQSRVMMPSDCPDPGNAGANSATGERRLLIGFRIPKGAKPPQTIEPKSVDFAGAAGTAATVMARNGSYAAELNAKAPHGSNYRYVGYSSEPFDYDDGGEVGTGSSARFRVRMGVKDRLVGKKFKVRPVVGIYQVSDEQPADAPIDCGDDPFEGRTNPSDLSNGVWGICIDSPAPDEFTNLKVRIKG